ncbi:MAG: formate dehydrogenase [Geminicoccaceae bacterium]|nr:formate dehydrogenase [Geminicoccaceae bacterium]
MRDGKDDAAPRARRRFLKLAGLGTAASGAALLAGSGAAKAAAPAATEAAKGYRVTDHVRRVYDLARF